MNPYVPGSKPKHEPGLPGTQYTNTPRPNNTRNVGFRSTPAAAGSGGSFNNNNGGSFNNNNGGSSNNNNGGSSNNNNGGSSTAGSGGSSTAGSGGSSSSVSNASTVTNRGGSPTSTATSTPRPYINPNGIQTGWRKPGSNSEVLPLNAFPVPKKRSRRSRRKRRSVSRRNFRKI